MKSSKRKREKRFKKSLIIYSIVLAILSLIFLIYIFITLLSYENNQVDNFLLKTVNELSEDDLKTYLNDNNLSTDLLSKYKTITEQKDLTIKHLEDETYEVYNGNRLLFTIDTKITDSKTKLGLFTYQIREITKITPNLNRGLFYYDVVVPSNFEVYVDSKKIEEYSESTEFLDLDFMYYNESMPTLVKYEINNLDSEKEITIKDYNGNVVDVNEENFVYQNKDYFIKTSTLEEAKNYINIDFDVMKVAEDWHLFLTKDLSGERYGFYNIANYLIEGTNMYQMAYNWAHNVDITFTSKHTLGNPIWPVERLENFVIFGPDAFACEVYLEKDMIVAGKHQTDIMHDKLYFIKENGNWKLINIQAIEEN